MAYHDTLAQTVASLPERRRKIESEPLPGNLHALLAEAARDNGPATLWNFF